VVTTLRAAAHTKLFEMSPEKKKKVSPTKLEMIRDTLIIAYPLASKLKVKPFYNDGRVIARAKLGPRKIRVTGSVQSILLNFGNEYAERLVSVVFVD
jgi:hypothetical protein